VRVGRRRLPSGWWPGSEIRPDVKEIKIAGAGISGLTAAINLAKAGRPVHVFEKRSVPGARFDGDYQFIENWTTDSDILEFLRSVNIEPSFILWPQDSVTAFDAFGRVYPFRVGKPGGYAVRRGTEADCLDRHLLDQARKAGAVISLGTRLDPSEADIIATGPGRSLVLLRGVAFETDRPDAIQMIFNNRIAPGFYAYLIVHEGYGVVCTARVRHSPRRRNYLRDAVEHFQADLKFSMKNPRHFGNVGISRLRTAHSKIVVGEAAGFQDRLWGFGIRYAIQSGFLAAQAILHRKDYWKMVRDEIVPWIRASTVRRLMLGLAGNRATRFILKRMWRSGDARLFVRKLYRPAWWKDLLFPAAEAYVNSLLR